jgi:hypothetical protein
MGYRSPSDDEKSNQDSLKGRKIAIFWDGDDVYYTGVVVTSDSANNKFQVAYDNDNSGELYDEKLAESVWMIWDDNCEDSPEYLAKKVNKHCYHVAVSLWFEHI